MNEIDKIRTYSKNFTKIIVLEFFYCSILFFLKKIFIIQSVLTNRIYIILLIIIPIIFNVFLYLRNKKKERLIETNYVIIIQILVLYYSFKFLM